MIQTFSISLPLPPSKNARHGFRAIPRRGANGKMKYIPLAYTTKAVKDYREIVSVMWKGTPKHPYFLEGRQLVFICNFRLGRSNADSSNIVDELADTLQIALGVNDRYFIILPMGRSVCPKNPGVDLVICWSDQVDLTTHDWKDVCDLMKSLCDDWYPNALAQPDLPGILPEFPPEEE